MSRRRSDQSTPRRSGRLRRAGSLGGRPHPWSWQLGDRTLVERTTRFTMLLHLPRLAGHSEAPRMKNGTALAVHRAEGVRDAITRTIITLPEELRRSLTWDQGAEMAQHHRVSLGRSVAFRWRGRSPSRQDELVTLARTSSSVAFSRTHCPTVSIASAAPQDAPWLRDFNIHFL